MFLSEKALFSERKIIENPLVKKEYDRLQKARFDRKLQDYKLQRGVVINTKNFNSVEEIAKEEDFVPICFHIEKHHFKDTFQTTQFREERQKIGSPRIEKERSEKIPILQFEFAVSRTKVEKIEIFADDDPYLFAEEFSYKFSKFFYNLTNQ